jgi:chaperonin cofactor prefoldin
VASDREQQMPAELRKRRDELELKIATLRSDKERMKEDDYYRVLEPLMVELARLYETVGDSELEPPK